MIMLLRIIWGTFKNSGYIPDQLNHNLSGAGGGGVGGVGGGLEQMVWKFQCADEFGNDSIRMSLRNKYFREKA